MTRMGLGLVTLFIFAWVPGCASRETFDGPIVDVDLDVCSPEGEFTLQSTNPYFPMDVGKQWVLEGGDERVQVTVLDETEVVAGVTTRVIEEREWEDGELHEVSRNFFAQTNDGTVCYFGEDVDVFRGDGSITHEGAWRADAPGYRAGIIMPANPQPGMKFQTEVAPGVAEDAGLIVAVGRKIEVPAGTFTETIRVMEINPLEDEQEPNVYAAGVGLVLDEDMELVRY